jgi:hypothetical protein
MRTPPAAAAEILIEAARAANREVVRLDPPATTGGPRGGVGRWAGTCDWRVSFFVTTRLNRCCGSATPARCGCKVALEQLIADLE